MRIYFVFFVGFVNTFGQEIPEGCTQDTTTGYRYFGFNHAAVDSDGGVVVRFRVRAKSDAHIVLSSSALALNPLYEIVIGAAGNSYTDVRRTMTGKSVAAVKTPQILSESEYRGFWVKFKNGELEVGREGETMPILHWKDKDPIHVHYYAFATWTGVIGKWIHRCPGSEPAGTQISGPQTSPEYFNAIHKLHNDLLNNYNSVVRPVSNHSDSLAVAVGLSINHFDLDDFMSTFHVVGWLQLAWRDERLAWNESLYEGLQVFHLSIDDVWKPDITLYNSAEPEAPSSASGASHALIYSDGSVMWVNPTRYNSLCDVNLRSWPWDTQTCYLKFGSWAHDGGKIDLAMMGNVSDVAISFGELATKSVRWEVLSTRAEVHITNYQCCAEPYPDVTFYVTFKRRSPVFTSTVVLPAVVLVALCLFSLWVPPNGSEKICITLVNIAMLLMYLMYFNYTLPAIVDHQPAIVSFYGGTLVLVTFSLVFSIITIRMTRLPNATGVPYFIKRIITGPVGNVLCLGWAGTMISTTHKPLSTPETTQPGTSLNGINGHASDLDRLADGESQSRGGTDMEWMLFAIFVDRILFLSYSVLFGIMMAACF